MRGEGVRVAIAIALVFALILVLVPAPAARAADLGTETAPAEHPGPTPTAFVPFSPNVRVNTVNWGFNYQVEPTMAVSPQGRIYVGWKEAFTHNGGGQRVGFATSVDRGTTFSPNVLMPLARLSLQSDPWLTVTSTGRAYFTRIEYSSTASSGGISVTNTTDGAAWGTTYFYDDSPNFADKESAAHDAAGNLYWLWNSDGAARQDLAFVRSNDGGATWTSKVLVADGGGSLGGIVKVAPDGTVLAVWWSYLSDDILFDRSFDGGVTWGPDRRLNGVPGSARGFGAWQIPIPAMEVDPASGAIYVAWPDARRGNQDIYLTRSTDGGSTWSEIRIDDDAGSATQYMVDLAVDPYGGVHAAWEDARSGSWVITYTNSTDGGVTWGPELPVSTMGTPLTYDRPGDYFAIESGPDGTIYVVWTDGRGADLDIFFAKLERTVPFTVDTVPTGLNVDVDGRLFSAPAMFSWWPGSAHTVSAPSPQSVGAQSRRVFASWSDGGGIAHTVVAGNGPASVRAAFGLEHRISVRSAPIPLELTVDGVPVAGGVTAWWPEGSPHSIGATTPQVISPGVRYVFVSWTDGGPLAHDVFPDSPVTYEARFRPQFLLSVSSPHGSPSGAGWYNASTDAAFAVEATVPGGTGTRYAFARWTGDTAEGQPSATVAMDGPKTVTAAWRTEHFLTLITPYGTADGEGWYPEGSVAVAFVPTTVAVNGTVYRFAGWTGDSADASSEALVTMDRPKTLTATWTAVPTGPSSPRALDVLVWIALGILIAVVGFLLFLVLWRRRRKEDEEPRLPPPPGP